MITVDVLCTNKNGRLENDNILTDLTFQPINSNSMTHATGAMIGLPDPTALQPEPEMGYNLMSGGITVTVHDQKEADLYQIGGQYQMVVAGMPAKEASKRLTTSTAGGSSNVKIDKVEQ